MVDAVIRVFRHLPLLLVFLAGPPTVLAHRLDQYLQATLVAIEPDGVRLEINLTPGVAIADQVLALIDRDRDGVISTNEARAYADLLKRDLVVQLDQRNVGLKLTAFNFPAPAELRTGLGIIQLEFSAATGSLPAGGHKLTVLNRHLPVSSVYLFNAALPRSGSVQITRQKRNEDQSLGEIEFNFDRPANSSKSFGIVASLIALPVAVFAGIANRKSLKKA
jgi:hypothetical protein